MMFDLSQDAGEVSNIAKQNPKKYKQLFSEMMEYLDDVDARIPMINPEYDPEVYQKLMNYKKYKMWGAFEGKRPLEDDEK